MKFEGWLYLESILFVGLLPLCVHSIIRRSIHMLQLPAYISTVDTEFMYMFLNER